MTELFFAVLGLVIKVLIVFAFLWFVAWLCGFDPRTATAFEKTVLCLFGVLMFELPESK